MPRARNAARHDHKDVLYIYKILPIWKQEAQQEMPHLQYFGQGSSSDVRVKAVQKRGSKSS